MPSFGRYELLRQIARGGMAEVWAGRLAGPEGFLKPVAIKKVLSEYADDPQFVEMFIAEAKLVAGIEHPNVVQVLDFGRVQDDYFLAMEFVHGTSISGLQTSVGRKVPPDIAVYVAYEAARGLAFAHARKGPDGRPLGIVHRDVSPQNLLVSIDGQVKIADFGIAKAAALPRTTTAHGFVRGKLSYMAPEQLRALPLDGRADLFALGLVLFELASGRRFYGEGSEEQIYERIVDYAGPPASALSPLPTEVARVLRTALQLDPADRYATGDDMAADLGEILGVNGLDAARRSLAALVRRQFEATSIGPPPSSATDLRGTMLAPSASSVSRAPTVANATERARESGAARSLTWQDANRGAAPPPAAPDRRALFAAGWVASVAAAAAAAWVGRGVLEGRAALDSLEARETAASVAAISARATPVVPVLAPASPDEAAHPTFAPTASPAATAVAAAASTPAPARTASPRATAAGRVRAGTATGRVTIKAKPWAEVWIDGAAGGQTPWEVQLSAGTHRFRFVALDETEFERELAVPADGTLTVELDTATGRMSVSDGVGTWIVTGTR